MYLIRHVFLSKVLQLDFNAQESNQQKDNTPYQSPSLLDVVVLHTQNKQQFLMTAKLLRTLFDFFVRTTSCELFSGRKREKMILLRRNATEEFIIHPSERDSTGAATVGRRM